jgi:hypothetical protein
MESFPPNSDASRKPAVEPKRVERVTSADAIRRKKSLGKQFQETFIGGNARTTMNYVLIHVLVPGVKDMLAEMGQAAIERFIYGDTRPRRGTTNPLGNVAYHRMGPQRQRDDRPPFPNRLSRRARARHNFDEVVIPSREEAEEVLDRLFELISKYESATVADLYELTGIESSHTDQRWGWTDLRGSSVGRLRGGGYLLDLPEPDPM